ncbi:AP-3 complex subunit mu [Strigomonas culicis]|nr:AP-3 complex subunit mu [Strigomonas culicis]|eukprot:EPY27563.1 AP-3 complex subunit mu [Strigomonas culicis]
MGVGARQVLGSSGQVPWRDAATRHATNEILFDVVEYLDYVVDGDGQLSRALVRGEVLVNCKLSGMPDVVLRLDRLDVVDDIAFHRCVRQQRFDADRSVTFIPPDGKFTLLQYSVKPTLEFAAPSFYVTPQLAYSETGGRFNCMAGLRGGTGFSRPGSQQDAFGVAQQVRVKLLLPPHTTSINVTNCTSGSTSFDRKKSILTWVIGTVGSHSPSLGGDFVLDAAARAEAAASSAGPPAAASPTRNKRAETGGSTKSLLSSSCALVEFEIPNQNTSGLGVESVQVLNDIGKSYKGVKYMTRSGSFVVRTA